MNKNQIKIGFLSFAHMHAASYAHCLHQIPDVEIVGIADDSTKRGQEMAASFGASYFASAEALLDEGLDGVVICSENANHRAMVEVAAGKVGHILCEKPIASNAEDGQAIIAVCAATNTKLQIAFPVRFAPPIQQLKTMLDEGKLGRVYGAKCTNHGSMPDGWFVDKALSGGGAVIDHTVHVIDVLRWFWDTDVTEVYAEIGDSLLHPGLGIDDVGMLSFTLANGVYGTLDTSWSRHASYPTWGDVKIDVVGEKGAVQVDALNHHVAVSSEQTGKTNWRNYSSNMDLGLMRDFIEMICTGREPSITGEDGLCALEVALAAYRSAETGEPVRLS